MSLTAKPAAIIVQVAFGVFAVFLAYGWLGSMFAQGDGPINPSGLLGLVLPWVFLAGVPVMWALAWSLTRRPPWIAIAASIVFTLLLLQAC